MQGITLDDREYDDGATKYWWLFLITGIAWLWVALILLRLDLESVYAISLAFGIVAIFAGVNEFMTMPLSSSGWKWIHALLGVLFIAAGITAFFRPQGTFVALATIFAWFILFKGIFDVAAALMVRGDLWWLLLTVGILEILLAFWAAGYFRGSAILLIVWVGVFALFRGLTEIFAAFKIRSLGKALAA